MGNNTNFVVDKIQKDLIISSDAKNLISNSESSLNSYVLKKPRLVNDDHTLTDKQIISREIDTNKSSGGVYETDKRDYCQKSDIKLHNDKGSLINYSTEQNNEGLLPSSFDLHNIIEKYGDNFEILQLILVSKIEEDRRRSEEAKFKQKRIDFIKSSKEKLPPVMSCQSDESLEHGYRLHESTTLNKETADVKHIASNDHHYSWSQTTNQDYLSYKLNKFANQKELKGNYDKNQAFQLSTQEAIGDGGNSSFILHSHATNAINSLKTKRNENLNKRCSPRLTVVSPPLQLKSLEYLDSQRNLQSLISLPHQPKNSVDGKFNRPQDVLPPIGTGFLDEQTQDRSGIHTLFKLSEKPSKVTSVPLLSYHETSHPILPTLNSFEASIMKTLPFDKKPVLKSSASRSSEQNYGALSSKQKELSARYRKMKVSMNENTIKDSVSNCKELSFKNKFLKKLALPPNVTPPIRRMPAVTTRRRKKMQAITKIIETRDFPYKDDYDWKNNGNTTHKSTGQKSVYYKCFNSKAGCSVNKTVSFRPHGEYLIKYRGVHLDDCCKIKRIMEV